MGLRTRVVIGFLVAAGGCGDDDDAPPVEGCEPGVFSGTWEDVAISPGGDIVSRTPVDLSGATFTALVGDSSDPRQIEGTSTGGAFRIEGVAASRPITIRFDSPGSAPYFYVTNGCRWDSASYMLDRGIDYAGDETAVSFDIDGLLPWHEGHGIELLMPGIWDHFWPQASGMEDGATSGTGFLDDYSTWPLLNTSDDEPVTLYQTERLRLDGQPATEELDRPPSIQTLVAAGDAPPFTVVEGAETTVAATLTPLAQDDVISLTVDGDAFGVMTRDIPGESQGYVIVEVGANPGLGCWGGFVGTLRVQTPAAGAVVLEDRPFADPFPSEWSRYACTNLWILGPGFRERASYSQNASLDELEGATLAPTSSLPRNWRAGGQDPFAPAGPIGMVPTVSWDPPSLGEVTRYSLGVTRRVVRQEGTTTVNTFEPVGDWLIDAGTAIALPPGMLEAGESYDMLLSFSSQTGYGYLRSELTLTP